MTTWHADLAWRRSSYSGTNGDCVEVAWRVSSYSGTNGNCVEVAVDARAVAVRDSKNPAGGRLETTPRSWTAFVGTLSRR